MPEVLVIQCPNCGKIIETSFKIQHVCPDCFYPVKVEDNVVQEG